SSNGKTIPTPRPTNATLPSLPLNALAGTYHEPGYGTIDLCLISPSSECQSSTSESCLLARWSAMRVTQLSFAHFEPKHNPIGHCSEKPYWVSVEMESPSFVAEFSSDGVIGVRIPSPKGDAVWFDKLDKG
ncbi:hypothetical protein C8R44DRAFT_799431, partial [Mycena epipterygia]